MSDDKSEGPGDKRRQRPAGEGGGTPGRRKRSSGPPPGARLVEVDELEVEVEKLVAGGEGLARYHGVPIFVPRSAPGDRLRVRITERKTDYGRAEIVEIREPGPGRREPPCPFFNDCGGCDLQHLEDGLQSRLKAEAVLETLVRLGKLEIPGDLKVVTGSPWAYRLRTQLQVKPAGGGAESGEETQERPSVGYFRRGSHDLVAVDRCPILVPELAEELRRLPRKLAAAGGKLPRRLDLAVGGVAGEGEIAQGHTATRGSAGGIRGELTTSPVVEGLPHGEVALEVGDFTYAYDARAFFQAHRGLVGRLAEAAVGGAEEDRSGIAFDLYAGVGLFTLPLARRYGRVVAVEGDRIAARFCRKNARSNGLDNVEVEVQALETWIDELPDGAARGIVDPPRAGLHRKVRQTLFRRGPRHLTYVSCHPATLARDLRQLSNRYRLRSLTLLDLFPQTGHMEVVAQLERVS